MVQSFFKAWEHSLWCKKNGLDECERKAPDLRVSFHRLETQINSVEHSLNSVNQLVKEINIQNLNHSPKIQIPTEHLKDLIL
jgi:hypothetical protein